MWYGTLKVLASFPLLAYSCSSLANTGGERKGKEASLLHGNPKVQLQPRPDPRLSFYRAPSTPVSLQLGLLGHQGLFFCFQKY